MKTLESESESVTKLGSYDIIAEIDLGMGITGLIIPLKTHRTASQKFRTEEIQEIMCHGVDHYNFVETNILQDLVEPISLSVLATGAAKIYKFGTVLALRDCHNRGNYMVWNTKTHQWDIRPFDPNRVETDDRIMLLVKKRSQKTMKVA